MNKIELNNKLAKLYGIDGMYKRIYEVDMKEGIIYRDYLLIDDWNRLMELSVDNGLSIHTNKNDVLCTYEGDVISDEFFDEYESPQAATRFSIAMALVKLKEGKYDE